MRSMLPAWLLSCTAVTEPLLGQSFLYSRLIIMTSSLLVVGIVSFKGDSCPYIPSGTLAGSRNA